MKNKKLIAVVGVLALLASGVGASLPPVGADSAAAGDGTSSLPKACEEIAFSTEEDFVTQGPVPPDYNPVISDGDLLGRGCVICARNRDLLKKFDVNVDLGLDAVDVIDIDSSLVAFSTELDSPNVGQFTGSDLLATNGVIIPNLALLYEFGPGVDLGLDAVHFIGSQHSIIAFLDYAADKGRDFWLADPGRLAEVLADRGIDIWFSTEGTAPYPEQPSFLDGDVLSARYGKVVAANSALLPTSVPAGIPNRGVDFGLDALTADRAGNKELIGFSTEILYEGKPSFTEGDVLQFGNGVGLTNQELVRPCEPRAESLGLDALSITIESEETALELQASGVESFGNQSLSKPMAPNASENPLKDSVTAGQVGPEALELCREFAFSTEEDFITQGPEPPDGNPIISDGDLLGLNCAVCARNHDLLGKFKVGVDIGLDAVDVIDVDRYLVAFSTELDSPNLGQFTAGDLLATNGTIIPNVALLYEFDLPRVDLGLDAIHFVGNQRSIIGFLDYAADKGRDFWLPDPGRLAEVLADRGIDIWFSTEGTGPYPVRPAFLDGDVLSARTGSIVADNSVLLPSGVPAGIPDRGVDFGLDALTSDRAGSQELIQFSTEILYEEKPSFTDGDVLQFGNGVTKSNSDLIHCLEPRANFLGLDALSTLPAIPPPPPPGPAVYFADANETPGSVYKLEDGIESVYYTRPSGRLYNLAFSPQGTLYYSDANDYDLYKLEGGETLVYHHNTYLGDVAFDSQGRIYFSESHGGAEDGHIYRLEDETASLYYTVRLADLGDVGYWAGDFTFDQDDNLYLSNGNVTGANIYEVVDGVPVEVFSAPIGESIAGLSFDAAGNLFYASWLGGNIYMVDLATGGRELFYSNPNHVWLSDVFVVGVPVELKPDLVITEILCDRDNDRIGYVIKNIGEATAPASHYTALLVKFGESWEQMCSNLIDFDLEPEETYQGWFGCYTWPECHTIEVKVCADRDNAVEESEEENNCQERICECIPVEKPDLVITDVWDEGSTICYQIRNIGEAVAPKGHLTLLSIDDKNRAEDFINVDLKPGERLNRCFDYGWQCTLPDDAIEVCADYQDDVDENDETNNCREETRKCDITPPKIISGPAVSEITQNSAMISWETDEDSDSAVEYGKEAGIYASEEKDTSLMRKHEIILTNLEASTVYHFVVQSTDSSGNAVESSDITFETLPLPDDENPAVSIVDPGICRGIIKISAPASDNIGVRRVEFYLDDKRIFTDYSPPFDLPLDTTEYLNGAYALEARAFDLSGRIMTAVREIEILNPLPDFFAPSVEIITPDDGDTVSETTIVGARATDAGGMDRIEFYIDDDHVHTRVSPSPERESLYFSFFWDTYEVENGLHDITVLAYDVAGNSSEESVTVTVDNIGPRHRPDIVVRREDMTLDGNKFTIRLDVHNAGDRDANNVEIVDRLVGFQPTGWTSGGLDLTCSFDPGTKECEVTLRASSPFHPGVGTDILYDVVPILTTDDILYQVGTSTSVSFDGVEGDHYDEELSIPTWVVERPGGITWHLVAAVDHAFSSADYLIVTNPSRLFTHYIDDDVDELLSSMASLAAEKEGVLGYLDTYVRSTFMNLIEPGGDWSSELTSDWTSNGYLLIVGETEIVPCSWDIYDAGIRDATSGSGWGYRPVYPVPLVDNNVYADISGDDNLPELIVGRIIGDSAAQLMNPIQTSLLDQFERTDALVASGVGGGQDSFENNADEVVDILDDEFTVNQMYGSDYASDAQRLTQFRNRARDKDVLYYRDHGSIGCWSHTICTGNFPVNFGASHPFAFGNACLTGNYEDAADDDYCAGEAFLDSGAGVYIGAAERSPRGPNNEAGKKFFNKWVDSSISLGQAFKETKRELGTSDDYKRLWVLEYNLYGDPKYGASPAASSSSAFPAQEASWQPLSSLEVTVPDYEVTTVDGSDYVEIPDGQLLLVPGKPRVPFYVVSVDYAKGYEVQDVVLTQRSSLITATGLNLPIVSMAPGGDGSQEPRTPAESTSSEWYPEEEYHWQIIENSDGSTTLLIMMYPFYYNALTTDVRFYKNYSFDISYTVSPVAITNLTTDKDAYQQGDTVMVDIGLDSTAEAQDVILNACIRRYGSGEVIDGLLLHNLEGLTGPASFSPQWDSSGFEPGHYYVEATLKDTDENVLDRETEMLGLGISSGEITSVTATPEYFDIGDSIDISLDFNNIGTVDISGTAVIRVKDEAGETVQEFRHDFTDLPTGESISFDDTWDTSGVEEGSYSVVGYILYDGKATDAASAEIIAGWDPMVYDADGDGKISKMEAIKAVMDYFDGEIDKMKAIEVVMLYFE